MKRIILIIILFFLISGCSATSSKVSEEKTKELTIDLVYVQDSRTGLCYAVVSSRIWILGIFPTAQKGLGLTQVPCKACRNVLIDAGN